MTDYNKLTLKCKILLFPFYLLGGLALALGFTFQSIIIGVITGMNTAEEIRNNCIEARKCRLKKEKERKNE